MSASAQLTPAVLVELGSTVVVTVDEVGVLRETVLAVRLAILGGVLLPELGVVRDTGFGTSVGRGHDYRRILGQGEH